MLYLRIFCDYWIALFIDFVFSFFDAFYEYGIISFCFKKLIIMGKISPISTVLKLKLGLPVWNSVLYPPDKHIVARIYIIQPSLRIITAE